MKLELYKPYRTQGGWKAVVVGRGEKEGMFDVWHEVCSNIVAHNFDGTALAISDYNLISEWQEPKPPRTCEFWVNFYENSDGHIQAGDTYDEKAIADSLAGDSRIECKRFVWTEGE